MAPYGVRFTFTRPISAPPVARPVYLLSIYYRFALMADLQPDILSGRSANLNFPDTAGKGSRFGVGAGSPPHAPKYSDWGICAGFSLSSEADFSLNAPDARIGAISGPVSHQTMRLRIYMASRFRHICGYIGSIHMVPSDETRSRRSRWMTYMYHLIPWFSAFAVFPFSMFALFIFRFMVLSDYRC